MLVDAVPPDPPFDAARQSMAMMGVFEYTSDEFETDVADADRALAVRTLPDAPALPLESLVAYEKRQQGERERRDVEYMAGLAQRARHPGPPILAFDEHDNVIEFRRPAMVVGGGEPSANNERGLVLSTDQQEAVRHIMTWLGTDEKILTVGGLAGTGKTTLIDTLVRACNMVVAVCAYTGKAAHVLRTKGIRNARTIHRTIYEPIITCRRCGFLVDREPDSDTRPLCKRKACKGSKTNTTFERVANLGETKLVIVDEASMVSTKIHEDLTSFDVKILYVGDHGQLEPIGDNPKLMHAPVVRLEKIHRQAEDSDILRFAHHVRSHGRPVSIGADVMVLETTVAPKNLDAFDMIICGRNSTRVQINAAVRKLRGYEGALPQVGERIICLRNDTSRDIYNGMTAEVLAVRVDEFAAHPEIDIRTDDGERRLGIRFEPAQFGWPELLDETPRRVALFDFGYCLTVMKSQGSEGDHVLVLEWIHGETSAARWRYTAATRARKTLTWCIRPQKGRR